VHRRGLQACSRTWAAITRRAARRASHDPDEAERLADRTAGRAGWRRWRHEPRAGGDNPALVATRSGLSRGRTEFKQTLTTPRDLISILITTGTFLAVMIRPPRQLADAGLGARARAARHVAAGRRARVAVSSQRSAGPWWLLMLSGLAVISGIFYPITHLPVFLQWTGQVFPLYWLALRIAVHFEVPVEVIFSAEPFPQLGTAVTA
jgi:hypothetical protein